MVEKETTENLFEKGAIYLLRIHNYISLLRVINVVKLAIYLMYSSFPKMEMHSVELYRIKRKKIPVAKCYPQWKLNPGPLTSRPCMLLSELIPHLVLIESCSIDSKNFCLSPRINLLLDFLFSCNSVESTECISI